MSVARWNARVKLACDQKPALKAICASGNLPATISISYDLILAVWNAPIYCARVVGDTVMASPQ
jgi:hypothetical protein